MSGIAVISAEMVCRNGGATFGPGRSAPLSGYMVSIAGAEQIFPLANFETADIDRFTELHAEALTHNDRLYCGAWVDGDLVYLDLSVCLPDRETALVMAALESQLAIYDIARNSSIAL